MELVVWQVVFALFAKGKAFLSGRFYANDESLNCTLKFIRLLY